MSPEIQSPDGPPRNAAGLYLDLLKQSLIRLLAPDRYRPAGIHDLEGWSQAFTAWLRDRDMAVVKTNAFHLSDRLEGRDWPAEAETMIGLKRLDNLQQCVEDILTRSVPGDFFEAGVWRGGAAIFLRGILKALGVSDRKVWLADSFAGLPKPDPTRYPQDAGDLHWTTPELAVSMETVRMNFERYGLLDDQVAFLPGWFRDTLPNAPVKRLSLLRLDGDLYESTMVALRSLYPRLAEGAYVIIDDYGALETCRSAVDDFRREFKINEPILPIDWSGVYWRVERSLAEIPVAVSPPDRRIRTVARTTGQRYEPALQLLLDLYERRPDLQQAFPEVANWDFRRLIDWARRVASHDFPDGNASALGPFVDWYALNWVDPSSAISRWDLLMKASSESANPLVRTLDVMRSAGPEDGSAHLMPLALLITEFGLKHVVELGTGAGDSTVAILEAVAAVGGQVLSIDMESCEDARERIASLGLDANWQFFQCNALEVQDVDIPRPIDLLLVDTLHLYTQTLAEIRKFLPHVRPGGWIALPGSMSFPGVSRAALDVIQSSDRQARFYSFTHQNGLLLIRR